MSEETVYIALRDGRGQLTIDGDLRMLGRFISTMRGGDAETALSTAQVEPKKEAAGTAVEGGQHGQR